MASVFNVDVNDMEVDGNEEDGNDMEVDESSSASTKRGGSVSGDGRRTKRTGHVAQTTQSSKQLMNAFPLDVENMIKQTMGNDGVLKLASTNRAEVLAPERAAIRSEYQAFQDFCASIPDARTIATSAATRTRFIHEMVQQRRLNRQKWLNLREKRPDLCEAFINCILECDDTEVSLFNGKPVPLTPLYEFFPELKFDRSQIDKLMLGHVYQEWDGGPRFLSLLSSIARLPVAVAGVEHVKMYLVEKSARTKQWRLASDPWLGWSGLFGVFKHDHMWNIFNAERPTRKGMQDLLTAYGSFSEVAQGVPEEANVRQYILWDRQRQKVWYWYWYPATRTLSAYKGPFQT